MFKLCQRIFSGGAMKAVVLVLAFVFTFMLLFFLSGCAGGSTVAPVSKGITFGTGVGSGSQNFAVLPAGKESQLYSAKITPSGGSAPYSCKSVPAGSAIAGTIRLYEDCSIAGVAPYLSPGTTRAAFPVKFQVIDSKGVVAGPFDLTLEVIAGEKSTGVQEAPPIAQPSQPIPAAGITTAPPDVPPAPNNPPETQAAGCTSPYDGTWSGTVTGSGTVNLEDYSSTRPFSVSYDLEFTAKCKQGYSDGHGGSLWAAKITHAKASHPFFGCIDGCAPLPESTYVRESEIATIFDRTTSMDINFPNGASISLSDLFISQDGKTITKQCDQCMQETGIWIGANAPWDPSADMDKDTYIETHGCGSGCFCASCFELNQIRMALTKIS
jgi:hypothetical protein